MAAFEKKPQTLCHVRSEVLLTSLQRWCRLVLRDSLHSSIRHRAFCEWEQRAVGEEEADIHHCHERGGQLQFTASGERGREKQMQDKAEEEWKRSGGEP